MSDVEPTIGDVVPSRKSEGFAVADVPDTKLRPSWPRWMVLALTAAHGLAGIPLTLSLFGGQRSRDNVFFAMILCQCSLVGLWGAMGKSPPVVRFVGMLAAAIYLGTELCWHRGFRVADEYYALVLLATVPVAAIALILRHFAAPIRRIDEPGVARGRIQFSIRSLMLLMIVIACLLMLGRFFLPYLKGIEEVKWNLVVATCYFSVVLTSIWAMLGVADPVSRCLFVLALSIAAGYVALFVLGEPPDVVLIDIMLKFTCFLLGSLFVIRRCGYRLSETPPASPLADAENPRMPP